MKKWNCTVTIVMVTEDDATEDDVQDALENDIMCAFEVDDITELA